MNRKLLLAVLLIFTVLVSGCIKNGNNNGNVSTSSQTSTNNIPDMNKIPAGWIKNNAVLGYYKNVSKAQISNVSVVVPVIIIMRSPFPSSDSAKYYFDTIASAWKNKTEDGIETKTINILPDCLSGISYYKGNVVGAGSECLKNDEIITIGLEGGKFYSNGGLGIPLSGSVKDYTFSFEDEVNDMKVFVNLAYNDKI